MSKDVKILLEILSNEHVYSLNVLKEKLRNYQLNLNEEKIFVLISDTIYEVICHYKLEKNFKEKTVIYKCFKYLNADNNLKYFVSSKDITDKMQKTIIKINDKIESKNGNINNIVRDNISFLLKIKDNLELTLIQTTIPNEENIESKEQIEKTLKKFIFEIKHYNYVDEIFKTFPELINFKTHNNKYILDDVMTKYIESISNDSNTFDIVYYEKVINLFISNEKFVITKDYQNNLINRLILVKHNLSNNDYSRRKNKRIRFYLNDVINSLSNIEVSETDFFSNINYRYGIQDIYNCNYDKFKNKNFIDINNNVLDLTNLYTFTVDNIGTKSYDDAFSLVKNESGNYELNVYISDVSKYVLINSRIDEIAYKKASTIYLPNYILTMLPHSLTYDHCSLVKNNYRNVLAHRFVFSKNFDIISFDINKAIIKVDDNFNYSNILDILNSNDIDKMKTFSTMIDIASSLKRNNMYNSYYHIAKSMKRKYESSDLILPEKYENSHTNFVDSFMILTNYFVADLFSNLDLPFIYRVNTSNVDLNIPDEINELKKLEESKTSKQIVECIKKLYKPSYYSEYNLGHNGLNLSSYSHVTIPIRNYASLVSQRLEIDYLINKNFSCKNIYYTEEMLHNIVSYLNDRIFYNEEYVKEYKEKNKILKK